MIKDNIPFDAILFQAEYLTIIGKLKSPKELEIKKISHSYANEFVKHHHYLHRKIYVARNVSYGLFSSSFCVGVAMFGFPVWTSYPQLVPPLKVEECPELIRLGTMAELPKNTESYFLSKCFKLLKQDWRQETGYEPLCITSFCDIAFGFNGALYKATNFRLHRITQGRPTNPNGRHGKWGGNEYSQKPLKHFFVYEYRTKRPQIPLTEKQGITAARKVESRNTGTLNGKD